MAMVLASTASADAAATRRATAESDAPAIASDRNYISSPVGRLLLRRIFRLHVGAEDRLDRVLAANGVDADEIRTAVISHLHFDHVGGIAHIPRAELIVGEREWAQLSEPHPEREWILREHIEIAGARWRPIRPPSPARADGPGARARSSG